MNSPRVGRWLGYADPTRTPTFWSIAGAWRASQVTFPSLAWLDNTSFFKKKLAPIPITPVRTRFSLRFKPAVLSVPLMRLPRRMDLRRRSRQPTVWPAPVHHHVDTRRRPPYPHAQY